MMTTFKIHFTFFLILILTLNKSIAQDVTFFATKGIPFNGEYTKGHFVKDSRFNLKTIPDRFRVGMAMQSYSTEGELRKCKIEAVSIENIGDLGMPAPIVYDCGRSRLEWSSDIRIENVDPVKVTLQANQEAMVRSLISKKFELVKKSVGLRQQQDTSDHWRQHWAAVEKTIGNASSNYNLEAYQIPANEDLVYIKAYNSLFIYSVKENKVIFDALKIFLAYETLSSSGPNPIMFFRIQGDQNTYVLCESFDGYEQSYRSILNAANGETVLQSISF